MRKTMKKVLLVCLALLACALMFTACDSDNENQTPSDTTDSTTDGKTESETDEHVHAFGEWTTVKEATCTAKGEQERVCACGEKETQNIDMVAHTEVTDEAVAPTCTETGLTEGKHCSVCNKILRKQEVIDISHAWSADYDGDTNEHWIACFKCDAVEEKESHTISSSRKCIVCDMQISASEGILYDKSPDGTYAEVVGYTGSASQIVIADVYEGVTVTKISDYAFMSNQTITFILIPDSVKHIGNNAFYGCEGLTNVIIPDGVEKIGDMVFSNCFNLINITIPNSVISIGVQSFENCINLESITLSDNLTKIPAGLFSCCSNLKNIAIPDSVTNIGWGAFAFCNSLESVVIPNSVTHIDENAFSECERLSYVEMSNGIEYIGRNAFGQCPALTFAEYENCQYLGNNSNPYLVLICPANRNFSSYTIHNNTKVIATHAFLFCERLSSVTIPVSVTHIGDMIFEQDNNANAPVSTITYQGSKAQWNEITKAQSWYYGLKETTIKCTDGSITPTNTESNGNKDK